MKKWICLLSVMAVLVCLLSACNFNTNFFDGTGSTQAQSLNDVKEMLNALSQGDTEKAKSLMHPQVVAQSDAAIAQMTEYLAGRKLVQLEQTGLQVSTGTGSSGNIRQEKASFRADMEDGTSVYIAIGHISDKEGKGFASFQVVLGLV